MAVKKNTGRDSMMNRSQMYPGTFPQTNPKRNDGAKAPQRYYPITNDSPKTGAPKKMGPVSVKVYKPSGARMKQQPPSTSRSM